MKSYDEIFDILKETRLIAILTIPDAELTIPTVRSINEWWDQIIRNHISE